MIKRSFLALLLSSTTVFAQASMPDASTAAEVLRRANNYWITNNTVGNAGWARGAYYTGNQRATRVLGEHAYHNRSVSWGAVNLWKIGPEGSNSADAYCCGQTYIDLYRLDPQAIYLADIKSKTDALVTSPAVDGWWWIDAFYMQGSVLARLGNLTGDTNYFEKLWLMYDDMKSQRGLFDSDESLWYRDASYFYPGTTTSSGQKVFWSRGNGWVFAGLARVLQQMTPSSPHYSEYVSMFQTMASKLKTIQGSDGMWRSSLYDPDQYPNPETSGTGFFTYGMAWGVRNGFLPAADYTNTIALAWQGLTNLALNASGRVGYVQGVGAGPAAASESNTTDFGVGAFLLACSEIFLLAPDSPALRPWAGADQTLFDTNNNGIEPIVLDASQTEIYRATPVSYSWWEGANQFASGITAQTNLPLGQHVITLKILASDGITYTDSVSVNVTTPLIMPDPVLKLSFDFEDGGTTTTDSVSGVSLNLASYSGTATDLHGALGTGVGGSGKALNFTAAASQGGNGPIAATVGNATVNFAPLTGFTITMWIKPAASLFVSGFPRFFSIGTNGTTDRATLNSLQLLSNGNLSSSTALQAYVNTLQSSTSAFGAFDMPTGEWRFLALTYDGTALNFYGGSESNAVTLISSASFPAGNVTLSNSWNLFLGNRLDRTRAFRGWIDQVRFYANAAQLNGLETIRQSAVAPPEITSAVTGTNLVLRTNTRTGFSYILQAASDLNLANWTSILTNNGDGGTITNTVQLNPSTPKKFFRYIAQ